VEVFVGDLEAAAKWYKDVLGLTEIARWDPEPLMAGPQGPAAGQQSIKHSVLSDCEQQNVGDPAASGARLPLLLHCGQVEIIAIPFARELLFSILIDCGGDNGLHDVRIIADGSWGQGERHLLHQFFHCVVVDIREVSVSKGWINPLVERVSAIVDSGLLDGVTFAVGKRLQP